MIAHPHPTSPPAFLNRQALVDHIRAMGHDVQPDPAGDPDEIAEWEGYMSCQGCGAWIEEDGAGLSVDERLLWPCVEPIFVNFEFKE